MTLSISTLAAIQKAGSAAFAADEKLKQAASNYAERVQAAISANPYHLGNDALIENWKTVARLSQTLAGIEAEIRAVFKVASELTDEDQPTVVSSPALAAPERASKKSVPAPTVKAPTTRAKAKTSQAATRAAAAVPKVQTSIDLTPTDVVVKSVKKTAKAKTRAATAAPAKSPKKAAVSKRATVKVQPGELSGNAAKLLTSLVRVINATEFTDINQTAMSKDAGIALGSMTAALKKLTELGRIVSGPTGGYKLTPAPQSVVAAETAETPSV